jgi:acetyl-CoA carboxylase biotin carboxyl carrier protein
VSDPAFDPEQIRTLATILAETGLTEIEIEGKDLRIRVARAHPPVAIQATAHVPPHVPAGPAAASVPAGPAVPNGAAEPTADDADHPGAVLSPMVGVVYLAPEPGAPAFVSVGQSVSVGQTLVLIEAMKTFNQIRATRAGTVTRILVAAGSPVEYGEPLLIVE